MEERKDNKRKRGKKIIVSPDDTYEKDYEIRPIDKRTMRSFEVIMPRIILEKHAKSKNMSVAEFIEKYKINYLFNSFPGAHIQFVEKEEVKVDE